MGQQTIQSTFRSAPPDPFGIAWNAFDTTTGPNVQWTPGSTIVDPVSIQPPIGQVWSVAAWTITLSGILNIISFSGPPAYGKLGKIIGGIVHAAPVTPPTSGAPYSGPWVNPALPLPAAAAGLDTIWDGQNDPCFPILTGPPKLSPALIVTNVLSTPIELQTGDSIQIGLWIMPSLARNTQISVFQGAYTITYDDGLPQQPGWGDPPRQ